MRFCLALCLFACAGGAALAQTPAALRTRAEATDYVETSRYADVVAFLEALAPRSPLVHLSTYGYTTEGRAMPLAVVGTGDLSPDALRGDHRVRVLLQGNIHAGEVEGKEALLEILRSIAGGAHPAWTDSLVLLVTPIYNADGNERVGLYNRPWQHGPVGGMGQRPNAQGLDLNRDHTRLASPEAHAFARLLNQYDPHVVLDLHTTDGSFHGYHLTYAPGLNPNTPAPITHYLRSVWLPEVTRAMHAADSLDVYYYGNFDGFEQRPGSAPGWYTFDHRPRFNNNYVGLRGRFAILSEAYSYLPFGERIRATRRFVERVLDFAALHAPDLRAATAASDALPVAGTPIALRSELAPPTPATILVGDVAEERNPFTGAPMYRRAGAAVPTPMPEYGLFAGTLFVEAPAAYLIPAGEADVLEKLRAHGFVDREVTAPTATVERFVLDSVQVAERAFQNAREQTVFGHYETVPDVPIAGMRRLDVAGPLARLAVYLLEPQSDDGFAAWGLFGERLQPGTTFPIWRLPAAPRN